MAPTPSSSSKSNPNHTTQIKTPQSKHRLQFHASKACPSPNPNLNAKDPPTEHPVEVIARIRDHPDRKDQQQSTLQVNPQKQSIRVRADFGYRDFTLDGVSLSEEEDLGGFYCKFVQSRINRVKLGDKCTIMMYGPTGSGKSHTMFGCSKQPGIVYRSLKDILGDEEEDGARNGELGVGTFVQVSILEIYNEEIYDLLSNGGGGGGGGGFGFGWPKGNGSNSKVKLEVMGKKAKNAAFISGHEAGKISKEIQKVEKRRIVKSTLCNDRSSRSHCMVILDVPTVGGRLMLVDMAGSENIEQAGQVGFEAKMQTAKINQGNIALKRVVESIANGDSHVPFRDSKLTMLLQDSFEDDKSKILMILCASPDPKEIHKTISTLEYGAKAKCIVRGPLTPTRDKTGAEDSSSAVILGSRLAAMDEFILKLQRENKLREKEKIEAHKELMKKEEEVSALTARLKLLEERSSGVNEEDINMKVKEKTQIVKLELERKLEECQRMANERILQQQKEVEMLRQRLEEIEFELLRSGDGNTRESISKDNDVCLIAKRLLGIYANEDPGMVKSMDLDMDDQSEVKFVGGVIHQSDKNGIQAGNQSNLNTLNTVLDNGIFTPKFGEKVSLSTVFEEEEVEEEEEPKQNVEDEEEEKEMIEEKRILVEGSAPNPRVGSLEYLEGEDDYYKDRSEDRLVGLGLTTASPNGKDSVCSRRLRIQNIFTLCGNHRELSQHIKTPMPLRKGSENIDPLLYPEMMTDGNDPDVKPVSKEILEVQKFVPGIEDVKDLQGATKGTTAQCQNLPPSPLPLRPLENILPATPYSSSLQKDGHQSPKISQNLGSTPFITVRK